MNMFVPAKMIGFSSKRNRKNVGTEDVDYESEELESSDPDDSDNKKLPKYDKFIGEMMNKDFQLILGIKFNSLSEFKDVIREWSVLNGREITFVKNESYRIRVKCMGNYGFEALCSKVSD